MDSEIRTYVDDSGGEKLANSYQDPPILLAVALPPENIYQQVIIDDDGGGFGINETTPLVAVHDNNNFHDPMDGEERTHNVGCRDWVFAVLFYIQLVAVIYSSIVYSPKGYEKMDQFLNYTWILEQIQQESDDMTPEQWQQLNEFVSQTSDYVSVHWIRILLWNLIPGALFGYFIVHSTVLFVLPHFSRQIVQSSLLLTVVLSVVIVIGGLAMAPSVGGVILGSILIGAVIYYVRLVWPMISFAAVNLKVALIGINSNTGTHLWAFFSCKLGPFWILYWLYATIGILFYLDGKCTNVNSTQGSSPTPSETPIDDDCGQGRIFFLLLISCYWTNQVIMNTVEVTVAGVMATWCFDKDAASGCCSSAVASSLYRSATYSFGSICLGSLLQGIVQLLRKIIPDPRARRSTDNDQLCCGLCFCMVECFARVLEDVLDYFHQWAYVFVGIYGYGYVESGRRVLELFAAKGWTNIISERLANYVTGCITIAMGVLTGLLVWVFTTLVDSMNDPVASSYFDTTETSFYVYGPLPRYISFFVGFGIGSVTASVMMSVVRGGVNTLIVCFADSPSLLEENHPELTQEIVTAWAEAFPETISKHALPQTTSTAVAMSVVP